MGYTVDAVRLALTVRELSARVASMNVANASKPGATALRLDFAEIDAALQEISKSDAGPRAIAWIESLERELREIDPQSSSNPINLDEQVAALAVANAEYQALTEALSRHFGLMRIAIAGRI